MRLRVTGQRHGLLAAMGVNVQVHVCRCSVVCVVVMMMAMGVTRLVIVIVILDSLFAHAEACALSCVAIMRPTAIAAPKPLSIFTTVMPEAQLVSMPNMAVNPASAVP